MKRSIRKAVAFSGVLAMMAILMVSNASAENKPSYESQTVLENQYDAAVNWNDSAVFIKNGSVDSITGQTELKMVKPDGTISDFANTQNFDKIYTTLSDSYYSFGSTTDSYYSCNSDYLVVGKGGKKALLKDDGSFVGNNLYEDIYSVTPHYIAIQKGDKTDVIKLDSTLVKEYDSPVNLVETDNSLLVISDNKVIEMFDKNLKEIDLSKYDDVQYYYSYGNYLITEVSNKQGLLSDTGKEIVPPTYDLVELFTYKNETYFNALSFISNNTVVITVYKSDGTILFDTDNFISTQSIQQSDGYIPFEKDNAYGIYNLNSETVKVVPAYQNIMSCNGYCFAYELNDETGVKAYDNQDILVCGGFPNPNTMYEIGDNRIVVNVPDDAQYNQNTKFTSYIFDSNTGNIITKLDKYNGVIIYNGILLAYIYTGNENPDLSYSYGILDENGNEILSTDTYSTIYPTDFSSMWLAIKDGKVGMFDNNGVPITDTIYQTMGCFSPSNYNTLHLFLFNSKNQQNLFICTKQNDKLGLIKIASIVYATGLNLDQTESSLTVGDTVTLKPAIKPADTTNSKIDWSSSDESVATVKDGVVTALKAGTATITAKTEDGGFTAACTITVTEKTTTTTTQTTASGNNTTATNTQTTATDTTTAIGTNTTTAAPVSPSTGEYPLPFAVIALTAVSALSIGITRRKKYTII